MQTWENIRGWFNHGDAEFVSGICRPIRNGVVVEVGVYAGRSTAVMAPICRDNGCDYYAIDNFWGGVSELDGATQLQRHGGIRTRFRRGMKCVGLWDYLNEVVSDSADAASLFEGGSVDFCFIDADHSSKAVRRDMLSWWPKVKAGGTMGGHDYCKRSVQKAVLRLARTWRVDVIHGKVGHEFSHICWSVRKP